MPESSSTRSPDWASLIATTAAALFCLCFAAMAQTPPQPSAEQVAAGYYQPVTPTYASGIRVPLNFDINGNLKVNVTAGGGAGGTSSSFGAAFPGTGTAAGFRNAGGNMDFALVDGSNNLDVNCVVGCVGGSFNNNADAVATSATNGQSASWLYGFNGTSWDRLRVDASKNLAVNINASSATVPTNQTQINGNAVATAASGIPKTAITDSTGNVAAIIQGNSDGRLATTLLHATGAFGFGFNGTSWDRLQVDASKNLNVNLQTALPAGANAIGSVTANAGTNLNTSALALEAGGNLAQLVTDSGAPGAVACATDTSSCNFNQLFQRIAQRLTTINTTLGSPLQAGGTVTANQGGTWTVQPGNTANTTAWKVDGSAVTQPVSGTVTTSPPSNASTNVAQINGVTPLMGNGATGTGSHRATISNDNTAIANWGQGATGAAVPSGSQYLGGNGSGNLTGITVCDQSTAFSFASTSAQKIISKATSKKIYICSIDIVSAAANNIALIEGTLVTNQCDTSTAGMAGGTTAATGWNFAANGGLTKGTGIGVVFKTANANFDVCLLASAASQVSGSMQWTQF